MQTTIQLDKSTVQVLDGLKKKLKAKSYNEVINKLVSKKAMVPESLFGAHPSMKEFKRHKEDWHEL